MTDFRIVGAGELADEIIRRLAPVELPAHIGRQIQRMAANGQYWGQVSIGPGSEPLMMHYKLMPDGRMVLQLTDTNLCPVWETTLRPVKDLCDAG